MTTDNPVNKAIELVKAGRKVDAQKLLEPYLETHPHDVIAWLWKARTCPSLDSKIKVLETCLVHNPNHHQIIPALGALNTQKHRST